MVARALTGAAKAIAKRKAIAKNKEKAAAKAKFDVYPSAYANAYMVSQYKKMGGKKRRR